MTIYRNPVYFLNQHIKHLMQFTSTSCYFMTLSRCYDCVLCLYSPLKCSAPLTCLIYYWNTSIWLINVTDQLLLTLSEFCVTLTFSILINSCSLDNWFWYTVIIRSWLTLPKCVLGAVSIRKTVLPGMAIPMLKIRRPNGRLIFNMEIAIRR